MSALEVKAHRPRTIEELDSIVQTSTVAPAYVAGGTDLLTRPDHWNAARHLVDLTTVSELTAITPLDGALRIGAAVPLARLMKDARVHEHFPLLVEACRQIGSVQIQNRATLGGNIANASPAGDSLPVLSVYDAELLLGPCERGELVQAKITDVMQGPGLTTLGPRYIAFIRLPLLERDGQFRYFRKVGQRHSLAISKVSLAVLGWRDGDRVRDIRICAGSVSPVVARAVNTEAVLRGAELGDRVIAEAARCLAEEVTPISDIRSTAAYRRRICGALLADALHSIRQGGADI